MFKFDETLMDFVRRDIEHGSIPMLLGEPGIGKSSWLANLADLLHTKCFTLACNQLADKADLTGARLVPVVDDKGSTTGYKQVFYPHAVIHDAIAYAEQNPRETPILFLDELNRTTPDVTSEALSIPTMRSIGSVSLPDNLKVVIAGNDKGNVTSLDEASISRFVLYHVQPDTQTFLSLDPELNVFIKNVLSAHPECIFCKQTPVVASSGNPDDDEKVDIEAILDDGEDMNQLTTPRTISGLSRWLNSFDTNQLKQALGQTTQVGDMTMSILQEGIVGHVGQTVFTDLLMAEIASNINTVNNQQTLKLVKPGCYDKFKKCADRKALDAFISGMTDNERSAVLVYMLSEKTDNAQFIQALMPNVPRFQPNDSQALCSLLQTHQIDDENMNAALSMGTTTVGIQLKALSEMF